MSVFSMAGDGKRPIEHMQTRRFAPADTARRYPYPIEAAFPWQRTSFGFRGELPLPDLDTEHIIVPSFAMLDEPSYGFRFSLRVGAECWNLSPIAMESTDVCALSTRVSTHIDYFQTHEPLAGGVLVVEVAGERIDERPHLLTLATRAFRATPHPGSRTTNELIVPPVSQLTAPRQLRHRICSTTCVNMVLSYHGVATHNGELTALTQHVPSQMYGVWPLNMWAASRKGALGAIELFSSLDDAVPALDAGVPVVASIRFAAGNLPGAPLTSTGGHLVVVTALTPDEVVVNDPAGRHIGEVYRRYPRDRFAAAWLTERGAAYAILPPRDSMRSTGPR